WHGSYALKLPGIIQVIQSHNGSSPQPVIMAQHFPYAPFQTLTGAIIAKRAGDLCLAYTDLQPRPKPSLSVFKERQHGIVLKTDCFMEPLTKPASRIND